MVNKISILRQYASMKKVQARTKKALLEKQLEDVDMESYHREARTNELHQIDGVLEMVYELESLLDDMAD